MFFCAIQLIAQPTKIEYSNAPYTGNNYVRKLVTISPSNIWAGYTSPHTKALSNLGVANYNGSTWKHYRQHNSTTGYQLMKDFVVTATGKVWIAALNGLFYLNPDDTLLNNHFNTNNSNLLGDSLLCLTLLNDKVWAYTNRGLCMYDGSGFTNYAVQNYPVLGYKISKMVSTKKGEIFLASNKGLIHFKNNNFSVIDSNNSALKSSNITALFADENDNVWVGTALANGYTTFFVYTNALYPLRPNECDNMILEVRDVTANKNGDVVMRVHGNSINREGIQLFTFRDNNIYDYSYIQSGYHNPELYTDGSLFYLTSHSGVDKGIFIVSSTQIRDDDSIRLIRWHRSENLDANNISMPISSSEDFGINYQTGETTRSPKGSCKSNIFSGSLWLGCVVNNEVHLAAQTYRQGGIEFVPGPINKGFPIYDSIMQKKYNRLWKIDKPTIDKFKTDFANGQTFAIPDVILTWPAHGDEGIGQRKNMAPFIDNNHDGKYNPYDGDYPDIKGDMSVFFIMNDAQLHSETGGLPFEFEFYVMAYSYACSDIKAGSSNEVLNNTVFMEYKMINRSSQNFNGIKAGLWLDIDNGNERDDYVGCNPKIGYAYGYNGDNFDEGASGYGAHPPATAAIPLGGDSTQSYMSNFYSYQNDFSVKGNPSYPLHYWYALNTRYRSNEAVVYPIAGGNPNPNDTTLYMFPGKNDLQNRPEWSEYTFNNPIGSRTFVLSIPSFNLAINKDTAITFALVFSQTNDTTAYPNPILNKLENDVLKVKSWFANNTFPTCSKLIAGENVVEESKRNVVASLYPNPSNGLVWVKHSLGIQATIKIYNLSGVLLQTIDNATQNQELDLGHLAQGFYFIQISTPDGYSKSLKFIKH